MPSLFQLSEMTRPYEMYTPSAATMSRITCDKPTTFPSSLVGSLVAKTYPGGVCRVAGDESSGVRTVMLVAAAVCGERDTIDEQRPCLPTLSI